MPTDPYVPADPESRPRQQQNLPPGVALPAPTHWRADRPGDPEGPIEPTGELFGNPGPNVGYAYTLVQRVGDRLKCGPHEDPHDVKPVVAELAGRRAGSFGRAPVIKDIEVAMAILGYDGTAADDFVETRSRLVHEAGHDYRRRRVIVNSVPEELLRAVSGDARAEIDAWRVSLRTTQVPTA